MVRKRRLHLGREGRLLERLELLGSDGLLSRNLRTLNHLRLLQERLRHGHVHTHRVHWHHHLSIHCVGVHLRGDVSIGDLIVVVVVMVVIVIGFFVVRCSTTVVVSSVASSPLVVSIVEIL